MKLPHWKQANPVDQLVTITGAIEGQLSNMEDGITSLDRGTIRIQNLLKEILQLEPFLRNKENWS